MTRHPVIGLWLTACVWFLGNAGCSRNHEPLVDEAPAPVVNQQEGSAAKKGGSPQLRTLAEQALFLWQRDIDEYRCRTKDPESLRPQAEEFMRAVQLGMLPRPRGPGIARTAQMGKRLFEQGCRDPLLKTYYGVAVFNDRGRVDALPVLLEGINGWPGSDYPFECRRVGMFKVFSEAKDYAQGMDWTRARQEVAMLAAQRVGDATVAPEMRRLVFYELGPLLADRSTQNWEDAIAIHESCAKVPTADPWIIHMLAGRAHESRAWHHRGVDAASRVPREAWGPFRENLEKAAEQYAEAQKLHPECPEPAAYMISVAMAGGSEETPQAWFGKAVAAELDYMLAYDRMRWTLRPRWGGSHEAMYQFGCRSADSRRYDTMAPFVFLQVVDNIDEERGYDGEVWRREGVYAKAKEVLEGMANEPSRADGAGSYPTRSSVMSVHVALAERMGQYREARRLADGLGERLDRRIFDQWCAHPEFVLASIYAFTGKGSQEITKASQTLDEAPKPYSDQVLARARELFQKALAADDNERSTAFCRARLAGVEGLQAFNAGKWFAMKVDPTMLRWRMAEGTWSRESENSAIGYAHMGGRVFLRPFFVPSFPLEIEFDVDAPTSRELPSTLGLFIPRSGPKGVEEKAYHQFFVRTYDNLAGIEIGGKSKTVPCELNRVNRIRVQLAEGRAVLHVNGQLSLDRTEEDFHPGDGLNLGCFTRLFPQSAVRLSNLRIRKWEPPREDVSPKQKGEQQPKKPAQQRPA